MKKFYSIAAAALFCCTMANAQAYKLHNNFFMKTCAILPADTHPVVTPTQQEDGTTKDVVTCPEENKITGIADKVASAFLDENYTAFPLSGGTAKGMNYHVLEQDYTDAETGVTFKAGTYSCLNSNTAISFYDRYNPQGLQNIKQVIFYLASGAQMQFYARQYEGNNKDADYCHFEGDPTNRKLKNYWAPGFTTPLEGAAQWYEMHFTKPLKLVVDLTNKQGTEEEMTSASLTINKNGGTQEVVNSYLQFYEKATDGDGNTVQGEKLIPWTEDSKFCFQFKKKAYVMGVAIVCGTDGAAYRTIDLSEEAPQWSDATGISEVIKNTVNANERIYSIDGKFVGTDASALSNGIYVKNGKKFVK